MDLMIRRINRIKRNLLHLSEQAFVAELDKHDVPHDLSTAIILGRYA